MNIAKQHIYIYNYYLFLGVKNIVSPLLKLGHSVPGVVQRVHLFQISPVWTQDDLGL
jgi:hypothetical protein